MKRLRSRYLISLMHLCLNGHTIMALLKIHGWMKFQNWCQRSDAQVVPNLSRRFFKMLSVNHSSSETIRWLLNVRAFCQFRSINCIRKMIYSCSFDFSSYKWYNQEVTFISSVDHINVGIIFKSTFFFIISNHKKGTVK